MKKIAFFLFTLLLPFLSIGQLQIPEVLDNLQVNDAAAKTIRTADCHYVMAGFWGPLNSNMPDSAFLMKLDPCGCTVWLEKFYPGNGAGSCGFLDVVEMPNGDLIASGVAEVRDTLILQNYVTQEIWTVKVDAQGQLLRSKTWGIEEFPFSILPTITGIPASNAWGICKTNDDMIALTGRVAEVNTGRTDTLILSDMLMKMDANFSLQWINTLAHKPGQLRLGADVIQGSRGDYWVGGQVVDTLSGHNHAFVSRANSNGQLQWDSLYMESPAQGIGTAVFSLAFSASGDIMAAGRYQPPNAPNQKYDAFLLEINPTTGQLLSQNTYGLLGLDDGFLDLKPYQNGYWAAGYVEKTGVALQLNQQLIPQDTLWVFYPDYAANFSSVLPIPNTDSLVIGGSRFQAGNGFDSTDVLFISTAYDSTTCSPSTPLPSYRGGIIIQIDDINTKWQRICQVQSFLCDTVTAVEAFSALEKLRIYPNPTDNRLFIEWDDPEPFQVQIWDMQGRLLLEKEIRMKGELNLMDMPTGMYVIAIKIKDQNLQVRRIWMY